MKLLLQMASAANIPGQARNASVPSREKCYVRFINKTNRTIQVVWIDFTANYVKYKPMKNEEFIDVDTYTHHKWIATDAETKDSMLLNGEFKYEPQTAEQFIHEHLKAHSARLPSKLRIVVYITLPLYSLYFRTLLAIRDRVESEEDVETLELAKQVKEELKKVVRRRMEKSILVPPQNGGVL